MAAVVMLVDLEVDDLFFVQRLQVPSGSKMICFCIFFVMLLSDFEEERGMIS